MNEQNLQDEWLTKELERVPEVVVPSNFAVRVREALPAVKPARAKVRVGRVVSMVCAVVLVVMMFVLAPHAAPKFTSVAFDVELMVLAQLAGIVYWLAAKSRA